MAGLPNGQRYDRHTLPRPGLQSQQSNSVPSTPHQKPRDRIFTSRSPSPRQSARNHSPHSVVSEAVGALSNRNAPTLCKYETGDEIRKRRIPYVDGGHEELGPPKKEPKKTLEPDEQEKLSGDMRELYDRLLPSEESEENRAKLLVKLERLLNEEWPGNDIRVKVFGSSGNLLSSTDSDVDICIIAPLPQLISMHTLASLLAKNGMEKVVCRAAAKVPIVKCWDPELQLAADLNVNNVQALQNTRMIKTYVELDDRIRPLAKIIKYWTKRRILNDAAYGGTISSYTWICMIINFLQRRSPPILPSLQKIPGCRIPSETGKVSPFADDIEELKKSGALKGYGDSNKESLGELLYQFFRHYGYDFEYSQYVVSIKEGKSLSRKEKGWQPSNYLDKEARQRLCVEEPFTVERNLGNTADDYAWHGIHGEIRRACDLLADNLQLEKCCEQFEFPPEEKHIFQRPVPRPKPTLTRSASQSGRPAGEPGSGRNRNKNNNRNQSAQRAGNRRASSGSSFANQRSAPFSPPMGTNLADYFQVKGNLHEALYQQYQYLQAQQDLLRTQLMHQQAAAHARPGDLAGSPRARSYANGLASPRFVDVAPQTAPLPLLPGYLYHYPARYAQMPPNTPQQTRSRDGSNTNPSSPSLTSAVPAMRRQAHRASVTDGSSNAGRSQSQPGRSLPHPLTYQQLAHPGYDVSGALPGHLQDPRGQAYPGHPLLHLPQGLGIQADHLLDNAMPKEYVGYYVSPQLTPQQHARTFQTQPPPMTLRDPPLRQRRVTPDLMPPVLNGRHSSRSPSPLGDMRNFSAASDASGQSGHMLQSPTMCDYAAPVAMAPPPEMDLGGPLIVNGSTSGTKSKQTERPNGFPGPGIQLLNEMPMPIYHEDLSRVRSLPMRNDFERAVYEHENGVERLTSSPQLDASAKPRPELYLPQSSTPPMNGMNGHFHDGHPLNPPLLSPVAEMRTPSPNRSFDLKINALPETNGHIAKSAKMNAAKQVDTPATDVKHERKSSASSLTMASGKDKTTGKSSAPANATLQPPQQGGWQQAVSKKKNHKKAKPSNGSLAVNGSLGQPLPANEAERKGG
ncbi:unnamed protein product [Zymoseptoria tritici ST99CH_3D7]|uniref:polynucleotide adenylyltransferase n=1 Tax=Zymoseptoria tritici (strain ST99CH_3D7) TaxID=1276538 RepID=A0A1X7RMW2_ZYMT9|nr:unnamed protein product [Zymoseptoria tritici ST99CH_3D7]